MSDTVPVTGAGLTTRRERPLFGVPMDDDQESIRYFTDDAEADAVLADRGVQQALSVAGAWSDLDWDEAVEVLERIRRDSRPSPPVEPL